MSLPLSFLLLLVSATASPAPATWQNELTPQLVLHRFPVLLPRLEADIQQILPVIRRRNAQI